MFCKAALTQDKQAVYIPKGSVTFAEERVDDHLGWALIRRDADSTLASSCLSPLGGPGHEDIC